jgi:predicted metal-dependent hydrolase
MSRRPAPSNPLQRSLFDEWFGVAMTPAAEVVTLEPSAGPQPRAQTTPAPAPASVPPVPFRHPHAQREIVLDGHLVAYHLRRARRRSIGFIVATEGLSVSAPRWVGVKEIEAALQEKGGWILRKLRDQQQRAQQQHAARIDWRDGTGVPFLGETVIVLLDPRATGVVLDNCEFDAQGTARPPEASLLGGADAATRRPLGLSLGLPGVPRRLLRVALSHTATPEQIRDAVQSWLQRQARRVFEERCTLFAQRLGVQVRRISLSSAATRWGSASADGAIRLNWRLIHFGLPIIDYVVAHELAHLREMNHSPAFWGVVRSVLPDYQSSRVALREQTLPIFD